MLVKIACGVVGCMARRTRKNRQSLWLPVWFICPNILQLQYRMRTASAVFFLSVKCNNKLNIDLKISELIYYVAQWLRIYLDAHFNSHEFGGIKIIHAISRFCVLALLKSPFDRLRFCLVLLSNRVDLNHPRSTRYWYFPYWKGKSIHCFADITKRFSPASCLS